MDLRLLRYFVAVAEEQHVGRAAARLHMTQPPLSRAVQQLETDLGVELLTRTAKGVALTPAGAVLYDEARTLLAEADGVRARVTAATADVTLRLGVLADNAGADLADAFRRHHAGVRVRVRESDLTDPTAGLRAGLVDVALTRAPFDDHGIHTRVLRTEPVGVLVRSDDPVAGYDEVDAEELVDRAWFRFPAGTDPVWVDFWTGGAARSGPVVRTVQECQQAVLWNGSVGVAPCGHPYPDGLTCVPIAGAEPSRVVVAWCNDDPGPVVRSFVELAVARAQRRRADGVSSTAP